MEARYEGTVTQWVSLLSGHLLSPLVSCQSYECCQHPESKEAIPLK